MIEVDQRPNTAHRGVEPAPLQYIAIDRLDALVTVSDSVVLAAHQRPQRTPLEGGQ